MLKIRILSQEIRDYFSNTFLRLEQNSQMRDSLIPTIPIYLENSFLTTCPHAATYSIWISDLQKNFSLITFLRSIAPTRCLNFQYPLTLLTFPPFPWQIRNIFGYKVNKVAFMRWFPVDLVLDEIHLESNFAEVKGGRGTIQPPFETIRCE